MASRWTPWANPLLAYWKHGCDNPTKAEAAIEPAIAALGERYRHQYPFWSLKYFADFALLDRKLIIEVDGDSHDTPEQKEKDLQHTLAVLKLGWLVYRCSNDDALTHPAETIGFAIDYAQVMDSPSHREILAHQATAQLDQLHQDCPHLLAAAAKKATRRSQSAKAAAARRALARGKRVAPGPAKSSKRPSPR